MEPLVPLSTNLPPRPKGEILAKHAPVKRPASPPRKAASSAPAKPHPLPPPPIVQEPVSGGEQYATGAFLGKGGFAICFEGKLARNDRVFALKVVKSEMPQKKMAEKFRTELQIHSKMKHPNIVQFHRAFTFHASTFVVLELCTSGSIMDMVRKRRTLSLPEVRRFMIQLCGAVKYMHKRRVAHRDLKMGNLFLDRDMNIKVGDFGLAACVISEKEEKRRRTLCGTPNYIAPEVLDKSKGGHNQKVDIWSLGVIFFAMVTGIPPFQAKTQDEIYKKVKTLTYGWPEQNKCPNDIPAEAKDLVRRCLNLSDAERPEPDEIVDHPFFHMYPGCVPRQLETTLFRSPPTWIRNQSPRGDRMMAGHSLNYDPKYKDVMVLDMDFDASYAICKDKFYTECGVGRNPTGLLRRAVGKRPNKSVYSECMTEECYGLAPIIPLPEDRVYVPYLDEEGDWSVSPSVPTYDHSGVSSDSSSSRPSRNTTFQKIQAVRTSTALNAAHNRLVEKTPRSHASMMRQQAQRPSILPPREPIQSDPDVHAPSPTASSAAIFVPPQPLPQPVLAGPPIRKQSRAPPRENPVCPAPLQRRMPGNLIPHGLQTKDLNQPPGGNYDRPRTRGGFVGTPITEKDLSVEDLANRVQPLRITNEEQRRILQAPSSREAASPASAYTPVPSSATTSTAPSASSSSSSSSKSRSNIGSSPLIGSHERTKLMPGTTCTEVMRDLRRYISLLSDTRLRNNYRRQRHARKEPHPYVVKWVDYSNRYGVGYVLDEGSVGCVFRAENGTPSSGVVVRDGEAHIRRKAVAEKARHPLEKYSQAQQLVSQQGPCVEFYENSGPDPNASSRLLRDGGVGRVAVSPEMFAVKIENGAPHVKVDLTQGMERARSDAEKVKRVKLVDRFGKYMIGILGSNTDEDGVEEEVDARDGAPTTSSQYIKFYQRLGNVGIWGFGDGSFQFNFPDHTKMVISLHHRSDPEAVTCQIDFYHLSPAAARYLATRGKMHATGFDTRAVVSDDISTYIAALQKTGSPSAAQLREVLEANAFLEKIDFICHVMASWGRAGRLGAQVLPYAGPNSASTPAPTPTPAPAPGGAKEEKVGEIFWAGAQEKTWVSSSPSSAGCKFAWVTVGAHGAESEYLSVSLKQAPQTGPAGLQCVGAEGVRGLAERLRVLAR